MVYILKYLLCSLLPASFSISCCAALFFPGILTPSGKFLSRSRVRIFLCFMISTAFAIVVKYFYQSFGTWVLQLALVLWVILLFTDTLKRKLSAFLIYISIMMISESISGSLILSLYALLHGEAAYNIYYTLSTTWEILLMTTLTFLIALLIISKVVPLLKKYSHSIHLTTLAELVFPAQVSSLITRLILYKENSPWYGWLIFLYWLIEFLCYFIVLRAFRNIYAREKEHELLVQQMDFTRKQMEFSQEMEKEYRSVRKWNHDMENHLFSLNYLINTKKYDEAEKYLESLLSDLPPEKRNL